MSYTNALAAIQKAIETAAPWLTQIDEVDFIEQVYATPDGLVIRLTVFVYVEGSIRIGMADYRDCD